MLKESEQLLNSNKESKIMKKIFLFLGLSIVLLSSCTFRTHFLTNDGRVFKPVLASDVKIYAEIPKDLKYDIIGSVCVNSTSEEATISELKEYAASLGADAVINSKLNLIQSYGQRMEISGVAVRVK